MPVIRLPALMRSYTNGQTLIPAAGRTVRQVVEELFNQHPALRPHLSNEKGELRAFVNVFINQENIKVLNGLDTELKEDDQVLIMPSITGGSASW